MSLTHTSREQLLQWLAEPEGNNIEFKEAKHNYHFEKLVDYCVALANEGGGKIILGVTDRRPRQIVGTIAFAEPGRTEAGLHDRLSHRIPVEEILMPEGRVLVVHVPGRLPGTAWQINGRYLKRAGDDLAALTDTELRAIFAETGPDFSAQICYGASIDDLDPDSIELMRRLWLRKSGNPEIAALPAERLLTDAELLIDGRLNYAALILLGTHASLGRMLAQAEIIFEYRSNEAPGPAAARHEFRQGFLPVLDEVSTKLRPLLSWYLHAHSLPRERFSLSEKYIVCRIRKPYFTEQYLTRFCELSSRRAAGTKKAPLPSGWSPGGNGAPSHRGRALSA